MSTNITKKPNKQEALLNYLTAGFQFRYDEIGNKIEVSKKGLNKYSQLHEQQLWQLVNHKHGTTSMDYLINTVSSPLVSSPFNPLKTWIEELVIPTFSNPIDRLCSYIVLADPDPNEYLRLVNCLTKWFVGNIKCLYESRYVHKAMLVFQGPSGIGKTPFFSSLLPEKLLKFFKYTSKLDLGDKDSKIALSRFLIILVDEINDFFKEKSNRDNYKSYMTQTVINERLPYGKSERCLPRVASFVGTCNESNFLNDETGSQRFTVFNIFKFKNKKSGAEDYVEAFFKNHIEDCWAYAYKLYKEGFDPEYSKEEGQINEEKNERYKYNSEEYETLIHYLEPAKKEDEDAEFMTSTQMCTYLNEQQDGVKFNNVRIGKALIRLKFERKVKKINSRCLYGYYAKKLTP